MVISNDIDFGLIEGFLRGLKPEPIMTVTEWAESKRVLPSESAVPGRFRMNLTPFNKEICDRLSVSDPAQMIVFKKPSQVGATETGNNWLGYIIDMAPGNFLYVMPTDALMKKTSKTRIQKMIDGTPSLREKVKSLKSRDAGNTILEKYFEGGSVTMIGANSPVGLASTPIRFVYMDEIDRYPMNVGGEGSALSLAETRTVTFGNSKKIFLTSTPTLANKSAIDAEFAVTGQRYFHVPCPHCQHMQVLNFSGLRYDVTKWNEIYYECVNCKQPIQERFKPWMMERGKWVPKFPEKEDGLIYGYHLNAMYSPYGMYSWLAMAKEYEKSKDDVPKMISFVNTKLGEVYEGEKGDKPDWEKLYSRAHNDMLSYEVNKPFAGVVFITVGVDVQADRLELMIVGWMKGKVCQQIDYRVLPGNTENEAVWNELAKVVNETWVREDGMVIPMKLMAVDSGYNTKYVYDFVNRWPVNKVIAVKGMERLDYIFSAPKAVQYNKAGKKIGKVKVWGVGVSILKSELYGNLKREIDKDTGEIPNGYCYILKRNDTTFYRGLTAEELMSVLNKKGFTEFVWHKKFERNEPLDTMVYARMAAAVNGMDNWNNERWDAEYLHGAIAKEEAKALEENKPITKKKEKAKDWYWDR